MKDMIYDVLSSLEKRPCTPDSIYKSVGKDNDELVRYQSAIKVLSAWGMIEYNGIFADMRITAAGRSHLNDLSSEKENKIIAKRRFAVTTVISVIALLLAIPAFILALTQVI